MHSEYEPFAISEIAAVANEKRSIEKSNIFFDRLFKIMKVNDKALYLHVNRNIHTSPVPYIYKKMSLFTYGVIREEIKRRNIKIRIDQYDIGLLLLNKQDMTEDEKKADRDMFFASLETHSPSFSNQIKIFTRQLPPRILAAPEVFESALMDMYKLFSQKLEAQEINKFWSVD